MHTHVRTPSRGGHSRQCRAQHVRRGGGVGRRGGGGEASPGRERGRPEGVGSMHSTPTTPLDHPTHPTNPMRPLSPRWPTLLPPLLCPQAVEQQQQAGPAAGHATPFCWSRPRPRGLLRRASLADDSPEHGVGGRLQGGRGVEGQQLPEKVQEALHREEFLLSSSAHSTAQHVITHGRRCGHGRGGSAAAAKRPVAAGLGGCGCCGWSRVGLA